MKLTYETGIATLVQFIAMSLLTFVSQTVSVISTCHSHSNNCLTNAMSSTGYFMLIVIWFGILWMLGYQAQVRRSRKLCFSLIVVEFLVFIVALRNASHHTDILGLITSVIDLSLAVFTVYLAVRLLRARGGRIVTSDRARRRRHPDTPKL